MPHHPRVALVGTTPATVLEDYARLFALAGLNALAGRQGLLMYVPRPCRAPGLPGERAEPWQLEGALRALDTVGCTDLRVVRPSPDAADPLADVCRRLGARQTASGAPADVVLGACGPVGERARLLLAGHRPALGLVDAVTVCLRDALGRPRLAIRGTLLASADPVALDALAARMLGLDPLRDVPAVAQAHARGLGCGDLRIVELIGDTHLADQRWMAAPPGPARPLACLLRRYGWPRATREVYEDWVFNTGWGRLYRAYL
ncbi:MAG TPA: hypothetical protein VNL77_00750 [Roseiflexaceae bacterium]|nr:hypothetical protein [Roseiflexaceae bacterium]